MTGPAICYIGVVQDGEFLVTVETNGQAEPLPLRLDLQNHSPDGFAWGYAGSGPSQLALALLAHALEDEVRALRLYPWFRRLLVEWWPTIEGWNINQEVVLALADSCDQPELALNAWKPGMQPVLETVGVVMCSPRRVVHITRLAGEPCPGHVFLHWMCL